MLEKNLFTVKRAAQNEFEINDSYLRIRLVVPGHRHSGGISFSGKQKIARAFVFHDNVLVDAKVYIGWKISDEKGLTEARSRQNYRAVDVRE